MGKTRKPVSTLPDDADHETTDESWLPVTDEHKLSGKDSNALVAAPETTSSLRELQLAVPTARRSALRFGMFRDDWADTLTAALERERERGAAFLWAPVFLGAGIALYFSLPREPLLGAFPFLTLVAFIALCRAAGGSKTALLARLLCFAAFGASVAQLHVRQTDTVMLSSPVISNLQGVVEKVERRLDGSARYTIDLTTSDAAWKTRDGGVTPQRIRLTARKGGPAIDVGQTIAGLARVGPPSGPAFPGGYDFSFQLWFDGIGGNGFFLGAPAVVESDVQYQFSLSRSLNRARAAIASTIRSVLPGESGALAVALLVGDRSGISKETAEDLRRSGLAHILAISGLHMALVAATVLFNLRVLGAAVPRFALHYPVKKWASGGALVATAGYLLISGGSVSTQRAFIMIAIMLLAILLDRRALTMRNVAIAAFIVLLLAPEALLSPGFQMSFAAVAALVATYEQVHLWRSKRVSLPGVKGQKQRFAAKMLRNIIGLASTSLIAGLATGLFAAYHFHRVAPLGLFANLLAMPVVSILVMPMALLSMIAMPFALETAPLAAMAMGIEWVTDTAKFISEAGFQGGVGIVPPASLILGSAALLIVCLSRTSLKAAAVPFTVLALLFGVQRSVPDFLVLENGNQIGVLVGNTDLKLLKPNAERFATRIWQQAYRPNVEARPSAKRGSSDFACDAFGCSTETKGTTITHVKDTSRLFEDCRIADILIIPYAMPKACAAEPDVIVLDRTQLEQYGAHAIYVTKPAPTTDQQPQRSVLKLVQSTPNNRPWTAHRFRAASPAPSVFADRPGQ